MRRRKRRKRRKGRHRVRVCVCVWCARVCYRERETRERGAPHRTIDCLARRRSRLFTVRVERQLNRTALIIRSNRITRRRRRFRGTTTADHRRRVHREDERRKAERRPA